MIRVFRFVTQSAGTLILHVTTEAMEKIPSSLLGLGVVVDGRGVTVAVDFLI